MDEKVNCPFCGNIINKNEIRCEKCGSLFVEPDLPNIKFKEFWIFLVLLVMTGGLFGIFWFAINLKSINNLVVNPKDKIKFNWLFIILLLDIVAIFALAKPQTLFIAVMSITYIALTYRTLRIIQKYSIKTYDVIPETNPYYIWVFNILYLVHYIDTYTNRVLQVHTHFNPKSPYMLMLIILLLILQVINCMNPATHQFYIWLFGL